VCVLTQSALAAKATSCTLEWGAQDNCVYELQWRRLLPARGRAERAEAPWEQVAQLIRGTLCRKRNLLALSEYEFQVRARHRRSRRAVTAALQAATPA
jgi:hypothetical protein